MRAWYEGAGFFSPLLNFQFSFSCYVCSFIMTTDKEHDNLFRRVCLPSASNYRRMRGALAGFVLKVNILYIEAHPALERFLLSAKWTCSSVSPDEESTHRGTHTYETHVRMGTHAKSDIHPTHTLACRQPWMDFFHCFGPKCQFHQEIRHPFLILSCTI